MDRLKILIITSTYSRKDKYSRTGTMYLAEELVKKGADVGVLVYSNDKNFNEYDWNGVKIYEYPYSRFTSPRLYKNLDMMDAVKSGFIPKLQLFGYAKNTIKYLLKYGKEYDVIQAFWFIPSGFFLALANKILKKPAVVTTLGSDIHTLPNNFFIKFLVKKILRFVGRNFEYKTSISEYLVREAGKIGIKNCEKIRIIPAWTRIREFDIPVNKHKKLIIGTAARLRKLKRVQDLIYAISLLKEDEISADFEVWIVGDGSEKEFLEDEIKRLNLSDKIKILGYHLKDWPELLAQMDIFVHCSAREGLSTVNIEAMPSGSVVIATNGHSNEELIEDGIDGFLYENGNPEHLKSVLVKVISDKELRKKVSENAKIKAKKYDVGIIVEQYLQLYREVFESKRN